MSKQGVHRATVVAVAAAGLLALMAVEAASASHSQPPPDITKMDYAPIGFFEPGDPLPSSLAPPTNPNPSGKWVAYDTNVYESLALPSRHPGDTTADDPPGSGDARYGFCPPVTDDPFWGPWGRCTNHQLEYLDYFERSMTEILGEFGVTIHRYPFVSPGTGSRGFLFDAADGQAYNVGAVVPGTDHPDETVLVSGHYDFTDSGPAAAWDSAEGHAEVIRIAKIMADYWRATGTRPSATVKFIPWDSEESGTHGSIDYVRNNIPPGGEAKVRGYFNLDPCAGAYPAFRSGVVGSRVPEVLQLADPNAFFPGTPERVRIDAFNARADTIVDEVFDHLDDRLTTSPGAPEIFVSDAEATVLNPSQRGEIVTALGGLAAFSSDYANFQAASIPIFNLFPDYFGPHADNTPASAEGVGILHTPRDNLTTINALTSTDQSGLGASEGWAKGMEMCAHVEGWYMLQPQMGGAQAASARPVAYFEALPNEAQPGQEVTFDGSGSYRYARFLTRELVDESQLVYTWRFGDGATATGKLVTHAYARPGLYVASLTVQQAGKSSGDAMKLPITVVPDAAPRLTPPPAVDADGTFTLDWTYGATRDGFDHFTVERTREVSTLVTDDAEGAITALWSPSSPSSPQLRPWQSSTGSPYGNKRHSGAASYWTGAVPPAPSPTNVDSVLTLKEPVLLPRSGNARLAYWSLIQSESDDSGRVEVAIDDGDPATEPHDWQAVDVVGGIFSPTEPGGLTAGLAYRVADLTRFNGKTILLRFRYVLGSGDRAASQPVGWYVDDVRFYNGVWNRIGTTTANSLVLTRLPAGSALYRVTGVYQGGVKTLSSNEEEVTVTGAG